MILESCFLCMSDFVIGLIAASSFDTFALPTELQDRLRKEVENMLAETNDMQDENH